VRMDYCDFTNMENKLLLLTHLFSSLKSFHCPSPKKMPFSKMDPSCTIGFYSKNVEHYERIFNELSKVGKPFNNICLCFNWILKNNIHIF